MCLFINYLFIQWFFAQIKCITQNQNGGSGSLAPRSLAIAIWLDMARNGTFIEKGQVILAARKDQKGARTLIWLTAFN